MKFFKENPNWFYQVQWKLRFKTWSFKDKIWKWKKFLTGPVIMFLNSAPPKHEPYSQECNIFLENYEDQEINGELKQIKVLENCNVKIEIKPKVFKFPREVPNIDKKQELEKFRKEAGNGQSDIIIV